MCTEIRYEVDQSSTVLGEHFHITLTLKSNVKISCSDCVKTESIKMYPWISPIIIIKHLQYGCEKKLLTLEKKQ